MLQRAIGVTVGAIVTFVLLLLFIQGDGTVRIVSDRNQAYLVAAAIGAIASFFWPIVIGWFLVRRRRTRQQDEIQAEVARQVEEQTRGQ